MSDYYVDYFLKTGARKCRKIKGFEDKYTGSSPVCSSRKTQ